jgi:hypothetical protein
VLRASEVRVVTPEQKQGGYLVKVGDTVLKVDYRVISRMQDGNYLVTYGHQVLDA